MEIKELIDLTHVIDPQTATRKFEVKTIGAEMVNQNVVRKDGQWYIMSDIHMVSHIGTHIEVPYHILPAGEDLSQVRLVQLWGRGRLLDLTEIEEKSAISESQIKEAAKKAGGIEPGDVVLCNLGYSSKYGTEEYTQSPYFSNEAIRWLAAQKIKMLGVDAGGVEIPQSEEHVNHTELFKNGICLIENVANFEQLLGKTNFYVAAFPCRIAGVEAFPVRVAALVEGSNEG